MKFVTEPTNILSKYKAEVLTSHHLYNLKINLEECVQSPVGIIYFFSVSEQEALKRFIEENLNPGFIQPTSFPYSALVFFIKNKDRLLHLYINFCNLISITKKNCYLLPLILDLLDSSCKVQVYTKINLCYIPPG